jgi:hypothetical protein
MGENEELGWFPRYIGGQPMCSDVGCDTNVPTIGYVGIDTSGKPIGLLIEETAQQINKAFEDIRKTMDKDFPMTFAKRKARKYYKPKFTL